MHSGRLSVAGGRDVTPDTFSIHQVQLVGKAGCTSRRVCAPPLWAAAIIASTRKQCPQRGFDRFVSFFLPTVQLDVERVDPNMSTAGSTMTKSGIYRDPRDTARRRVRHRDQTLLRAGMGLTTGLGWSDRWVHMCALGRKSV